MGNSIKRCNVITRLIRRRTTTYTTRQESRLVTVSRYLVGNVRRLTEGCHTIDTGTNGTGSKSRESVVNENIAGPEVFSF